MEAIKYDVFIRYSSKDYLDDNNNIIPDNAVSAIKETLSKEGISYWFDEEGIYSGQNFVERIVNNIEASKIFVYLSTANANSSKWTCKEIASADEFGKPIIPVRIDKSPYNKKVMFRISDLDYIEYYTNPESALNDLIISIKAHLQSIQEEENRKKEEEAKKREAELKRKEEEKAIKEQEEKRRREEQQRIVSDIELACTKLNNEEKKIELDRSTLLVSTEKVADEQRKNELKTFITSSSPIRQKQQEELRQLQTKLANYEVQLRTLTNEKEHLASQLKQIENGKSEKESKQSKEHIDSLEEKLAIANAQVTTYIKECEQLTEQIEALKLQVEEKATTKTSKNNNKRMYFIWSAGILTLICWIILAFCVKGCTSMLNDIKEEELRNSLKAADNTIKQLADGNSFVITDICVYNKGDKCGDTIISNKSTYLTPKIYTYNTDDNYSKTYKLYIKIFNQDGILTTGTESNSPYGYSYGDEVCIYHGVDSYELRGWGNETPGYWKVGKYRIEVWYNGKMLKSKEFNIY